jgi:hypothetical protein
MLKLNNGSRRVNDHQGIHRGPLMATMGVSGRGLLLVMSLEHRWQFLAIACQSVFISIDSMPKPM